MRETEKAKEYVKVAERVFLLFSINMYLFSLIAVILPSNRSILPKEASILLGEELMVPGVFHQAFTGILLAAAGCICLLNILRLYKGYRAQREFGLKSAQPSGEVAHGWIVRVLALVTLVRSIVLILGVSVALHALLSRALRVGLIVVIAACMLGNVPAGSDFYTGSYEGPRGFVAELLRRDMIVKRRNRWFIPSVILAFDIFVIVSANGWETYKTVATVAAVAAIFVYSILTAALSDPSRDATSEPRFGKDSRHLP